MKPSVLSWLAPLVGLPSSTLAAPIFEIVFGPAVSTGPSQVDIIRTTTTIVPGRNPPNQKGALYIWPGISNGTGDLIQSCVTSWTENDCGQDYNEFEWCTEASVLVSGNNFQTVARSSRIKPTDRVKIEYVRGEPQANGYEWEWHQYVTMEATGELLSDLTSVSGTMRGWGTATECQADCTPTIDPHYYYDTVITLDSGDFSYGNTIGTSGGASQSGFVPNEDGSEWRIDEIYIPIFTTVPAGDTASVAVDTPIGEAPGTTSADEATISQPADTPVDQSTPDNETADDGSTQSVKDQPPPADGTPDTQSINEIPGEQPTEEVDVGQPNEGTPIDQQTPAAQFTRIEKSLEQVTPTSAPIVIVPTPLSAPANKLKQQPREPRWF